MTDRELLELAAKAAGVVGTWEQMHLTYGDMLLEGINDGSPIFWNPLTDDGDALRLAVRLNIDFKAYGTVVRTWVGDFTTQKVIASVEEICGVDPYAATRRAITRAAAEIGARGEKGGA